MIGRVLAGRYTIVSAIGEGGMSRVWRAQDMNTGKYVAVKVLRDEYREDETFVRRFEREAQVASRMTHPNIANLLDVGVESDGTRYLVIEYVSGKTLKQFIQESGAIKPETAAQIIMRVLSAVQHAHQNGVIHRDIKPQNILIDKDGAVKVTDFGIARVANSQTMSQDTDTVMGSVYYFSPEQAKGADTDEKSDLYSVGIVFYEMLTGQVPFTGDTPVAIAMKHLQEPPTTPSEINDNVSPALDFVVLHAMEKRPRHRYASASDMLRDVRLALDHPDTILAARADAERREREARAEVRTREKAEKRARWMRRVLMGIFALILLALTALSGYLIMERILISRRNNVEVPDVIGKHKDVAITLLIEAGLDPVVREDTYEFVPEDVVADQSIPSGTFVAQGEKITIIVCKSSFSLRMPNVTNIPLEDAQNYLGNAGLIVGKIEREPSQAAYGTVIGQVPSPGTAVNEGDAITLHVSAGVVTMPRLIDMTQSEALQTLSVFGLRLAGDGLKETKVDDPAKVGKVLAQVPAPYKEVVQNSSVSLEIGVPGNTLYSAQIELDLTEMPNNTTVSVSITQTDGSESVEYHQTFSESLDLASFTTYSATARDAVYNVYYDDVLQYSNGFTYSR